ncbi:MAG: CDP-alcohol phosphatidyltransferase family protein, partial [Sphingomonadales bacterium]|nr:CDP-alcohol phosphatidyltransferase family protein [Sphingomonadales bacterium]
MLGRPDDNGGREKRLRVRRIRRFTIRSIAPNVMTILALAAGMTAIRFALDERWEAAIVAVIVAGVFDGLDGTVARLLKGTSR